MANPGDFAYTLKQQADIVRIIGDYVRLKKAGAQNFTGLCPFHKEKTPSFSVHATRQYYYCFGCHEKGDVFAFIQKIENISFPEAVRLVAQKLGIPMPKATYSSEGEAREARLRGQLLEIHERAVAFFQESLRRPEGARAREYLKSRGLDDATIAKFRIGYAPDSGFLLRDRLKSDFSEDILRESGLFSWKHDAGGPSSNPVISSEGGSRDNERSAAVEGPAISSAVAPPLSVPSLDGQGGNFEIDPHSAPATDDRRPTTDDHRPTASSPNSGLRTRNSGFAMYAKFRNRVMFPIANESGKVIAFTARTLSTDEKAGPKYLNSPETPIYSKSKVLFNLDLAKEAIRALNYAILVEGQMDCISVFAAGFHNVIASSGTAFTELQAKLLGRFSKRVVVNFDPDTAGAKATERTLGLLVEEEFDIQVLRLDEGFDPDLYIRRKGKDAYAEALRHSQKYFDYLIDRARQQFPVRSGEGKDKAVKYLLPHIQRIPSRIVRDELAQEIAQKLGIDSPILRQELRHVAVTRSSSTIKVQAETQITDAEKILIRALARDARVGAEAFLRPASEASVAADGFNPSRFKDGEFDPARQVAYVLETERLHHGLATESLAESLLSAIHDVADVLEIPVDEGDRRLLASILLKEEEELTADILEAAVRALRRIHLRRRQEQVQRELKAPGLASDKDRLKALLSELEQVSRALRDPGAAGVSRIA